MYKGIMILVLLVLGGAAGVNEAMVGKHIAEEEKLTADAEAKQAEHLAAKNKAQNELNVTDTTLEQTRLDVSNAENQLAQRTQEVASTRQAVQAADDAQRQAEDERDAAQESQRDFEDLNMELAEIKRIRAKLPKEESALAAAISERGLITKDNSRMRAQIEKLAPPHKKPLLPFGLTGKISSYDPHHQFVVLDIGEHHGVITQGELMVSRAGSLIGKVKVTKVAEDYSIANILLDWKNGEIKEGDTVIYRGL